MAINFSSGTLSAPTKVLQSVATTALGTYSFSSNNSWTSITGFSKAITTVGASSKILVTISMGIVKPQSNTVAFKFQRGGTDVMVANSNGSRARTMFRHTDQGTDNNHAHSASFTFLDTPSASAGTSLTYQLYGYHEGSGTTYINRNWSYSNGSNAADSVTASVITLTEIAA